MADIIQHVLSIYFVKGLALVKMPRLCQQACLKLIELTDKQKIEERE